MSSFPKLTTFYILFSFFSVCLGAQVRDSIKISNLRSSLLKANGTERVRLLNELSSYLQTIDLAESKELVDEALKLSNDNGYEKEKIKSLLVLATYYSRSKNLAKTDSLLKITIPLVEEIKDNKLLAEAFLAYGAMKMREGKYPEAMEVHLKGSKISRKVKDYNLLSAHLMNVGLIKQGIGNFEESSEYFQEALDIAKQNKLDFRVGSIYLNMAVLEYQKNNLGLSIEYNQKAYELLKSTGDLLLSTRALSNLGFAYNIIGNQKKALEYYDKSLEIVKQIGNKRGEGQIYLNQAKIYVKTDFNKAIKLGVKAIEIFEKIKNLKLSQDGHLFLHDTYEKADEYQKALVSYKKYIEIRDTLQLRANKLKIEQITSRYKFDTLEDSNELVKAKVKNREQILYLFLIIVVLGLFFLFKYRNKVSDKLQKNKQYIDELKAESSQQLEEWESEKRFLSSKVEQLLLKTQKLEKEGSASTEELPESQSTRDLSKVVENIKNSIVNNKDWVSFTFYFDILYPEFFEELKKKKNKEFTINEQRLISLIKIKLTTKEIANILSISPSSVLKAKTRLKSKFEFDTTKIMDDFIQNI